MKRLVAAMAAVVLLAACGSGTTSQAPSSPGASTAPGGASRAPASQATGDENAPIVIWYDSTREPALEAWKKAHPDQAGLVSGEVVDLLQIPAKIALANNVGKGWPDLVFNGANLIAMTATQQNDWAMDLTPYVSKELLGQFEPSVIAECQRPNVEHEVRPALAHVVGEGDLGRDLQQVDDLAGHEAGLVRVRLLPGLEGRLAGAWPTDAIGAFSSPVAWLAGAGWHRLEPSTRPGWMEPAMWSLSHTPRGGRPPPWRPRVAS